VPLLVLLLILLDRAKTTARQPATDPAAAARS